MFGRTGMGMSSGQESCLGLLSTPASSRKTFKRLLRAIEAMRLKPDGSKKKSNGRKVGGTDWGKLRRMSAARIREGIAADPDARATDENFWKSAKAVLPAP